MNPTIRTCQLVLHLISGNINDDRLAAARQQLSSLISRNSPRTEGNLATIEHEVTIPIKILVDRYTPGRPGQLFGPPEDCYEDEPSDWEGEITYKDIPLPFDLDELPPDELLALVESTVVDDR